jgi:hypothetical protein
VTSAIQGRVYLCVFAEVSTSWGRGCNGHRILRRVPDGGRHLGSARAAALHGAVRSLILAAPPHSHECRRRGDRDVRGTIASARWEQHAHNTLDVDPPKRFERRETFGPLVKLRGAQTPRGTHAVKVATGRQERTRYGYTLRRLGGRYRSDASRVSVRGESQDELRKEALAERSLAAPPDAEHERRDGETVCGFTRFFINLNRRVVLA